MDRDEVMKLALEAGFKRDIHGIYKSDWMNPDADCSPELERFAHLIVRECVKVCMSAAGNRDYSTGRMHCASDLKKHFGVKE